MLCAHRRMFYTVSESSPVGFTAVACSGNLLDNTPLVTAFLPPFSTPLPQSACQVNYLLSNLLVQGLFLGNPN